MNRASGSCETIYESLTFMSLEFEKERVKRFAKKNVLNILAENFLYLMEHKFTYLGISVNLRRETQRKPCP